MRRFVVEIEDGCWLAPWKGDPGRTCVLAHARQFETYLNAHSAMGQMKCRNKHRRMDFARVVEVDVVVSIAVKAGGS